MEKGGLVELTGMAAYLATLTSIGSTVISLMGNVVTFIMAEGHEMILVPFGVILLASAVVMLKRIV